jgi:hypothetical protein
MWVGASPCVRPCADEPRHLVTGRTQGDAPTHIGIYNVFQGSNDG